MTNKNKLSATVFGATGLVGKQIVEALKQDDNYSKVYLPNRREVDFMGDKVENLKLEFDKLENYPELFKVDHLFIAIGTTIKKAGSKTQFQKVDLEYPMAIAELAKQYGTKSVLLISSVGANPKAANFYLKTKGQLEERLAEILGNKVYFVRPSMLLGKRKEFRFAEEAGKALLKIMGFLMFGSLRKYRGIYAKEVAAAMIHIAKEQPKQRLFESDELKSLIK